MAQSSHTDAAPLADLTAFQRDLLAIINDADPDVHGLAIMHTMEAAWNTDVNHGRLYPNLDTLVEMGLVEKGKIDERTNSYNLTRRGERELAAHARWVQETAGELV